MGFVGFHLSLALSFPDKVSSKIPVVFQEKLDIFVWHEKY
jgi:hypothetical protein